MVPFWILNIVRHLVFRVHHNLTTTRIYREHLWKPLREPKGLVEPNPCKPTLLGGPWVLIIGVISRVTILITLIRGLITLLMTTHEPPSKPQNPYRKPQRV